MLSSPNLIIEGSHPYGEDEVLPDIGYEIVITFRKFTKRHDGDEQANHVAFDNECHEISISNQLDIQDAMIALTHEFIHIQQYMKGLLKEDGKKENSSI